MSSHQIFIRQNRLVVSDGNHEISYSLEEAQSLIEALEQGVAHILQNKSQTHKMILYPYKTNYKVQ